MRSCPVCGRMMILELIISPSESGNYYTCRCGYKELYDPFHLKYREKINKHFLIINKNGGDILSLPNAIRKIENAKRKFFNSVDEYNDKTQSPLDIKKYLREKNQEK